MKQHLQTSPRDAAARRALRQRVKQFYSRFNEGAWQDCYALIDPELTGQDKVSLDTYSKLMQAFKDAYGSVKPWRTQFSFHLDAAPKQQDKRPFAYVYLVWQDEAYGFHMFRDRWIHDRGQWFTRGLFRTDRKRILCETDRRTSRFQDMFSGQSRHIQQHHFQSGDS